MIIDKREMVKGVGVKSMQSNVSSLAVMNVSIG